jgi:hypothetical protein
MDRRKEGGGWPINDGMPQAAAPEYAPASLCVTGARETVEHGRSCLRIQ